MTILAIIAVIAALIGVVGSIVPGLPGPPLSWVGILLAYFIGKPDASGDPMSLTFLLIWLAVTIVVSVVDWVVPAYFTRATGGHKSASIGAIVGLFAGAFLTPVGMILGSLLGAFVAEFFIEDAGVWTSFKSSMGTFLGFIFGTGMKIAVSAVMLYYVIVFAF